MADKEKSEAEAKPEEISDKDLTEVVGGVQGVASSNSTSMASSAPVKPGHRPFSNNDPVETEITEMFNPNK